MREQQTELSRLYHAALQKYVRQGSTADTEPVRALGRQAMALGLETLDLARMHEIALTQLVEEKKNSASSAQDKSAGCHGLSPDCYSGAGNQVLISRSGNFFAEAITPIEETHRGAREANAHLNIMIKTLSQRTRELAESVEELKQEITQRTAIEESLRLSEQTTSALLEKSRQMQEQLRHLSRQLLAAQEEERRKISRELHDVIAQTLTGINVRLASLKSESTLSAKALQKKITSTQKLVEKSVDIVHRFARDLRPTVLDDLGLIPALQSYMKSYTEETGIRVSLKAFAGIELADSVVRTVLYRIAQEALTNVARHAQASSADVSIQKDKDLIRMEITDNGKGFEVDGTSCAKKSNRLGLLGMRERIEMIGGTFCIESAEGKPTTVRVEFPLETDGKKKPLAKKSKPTTNLECP